VLSLSVPPPWPSAVGGGERGAPSAAAEEGIPGMALTARAWRSGDARRLETSPLKRSGQLLSGGGEAGRAAATRRGACRHRFGAAQ